jgi:hypothetical protein
MTSAGILVPTCPHAWEAIGQLKSGGGDLGPLITNHETGEPAEGLGGLTWQELGDSYEKKIRDGLAKGKADFRKLHAEWHEPKSLLFHLRSP